MSDDSVEVLYITGWGRSGSTLLTALLADVPGVFAAGELRYIWERGYLERRLCGCRKPVPECEIWSAVVEAAFGGREHVDAARWNELTVSRTRTRRAFGLLREAVPAALATDELSDVLGRLYRAIARTTGARTIVDSSKFPVYGAVLGRVPGLSVRTVHLVRDPRAVAYSWLNPKDMQDRPGTNRMDRKGVLHSTVWWLGWNEMAERLGAQQPGRYLRIRYEDLCAAPDETLARVLAFAGLEPAAPLAAGEERSLPATHMVSGNPMRFHDGHLRIRPDLRWTTGLAWPSRWLTTVAAFPRLWHYGYSARSAR